MTLEIGELVICHTNDYSITNNMAICEVTDIDLDEDEEDEDSLEVKVVGRLDHSNRFNSSTFWVARAHFERYVPEVHGFPLSGDLVVHAARAGTVSVNMTKGRALVTKDGLKTSGKLLEVVEQYEGEYCCLRYNNKPIVIKKVGVRLIDDPPEVGNFCTRHTSLATELYRRVEDELGAAVFRRVTSEGYGGKVSHLLEAFERFNYRNVRQMSGLEKTVDELNALLDTPEPE